MKTNKSDKNLVVSNVEKDIEIVRKASISKRKIPDYQYPDDYRIALFDQKSLFKTSSFPRVYLSTDLQQKMTDLKLVQKILESPKKAQKQQKRRSVIVKRGNAPKFYLLTTSSPNNLNKISHQARCDSCKKGSLSCEASFNVILEEKRRKTVNAREEFLRLCKRPMTGGKEGFYRTRTSIAKNKVGDESSAEKQGISISLRKN